MSSSSDISSSYSEYPESSCDFALSDTEIEDQEEGYKHAEFGEIFHEDLFDGLDFIKDQLFGDGIPDVTIIKYPNTEECERLVQETYANYLKSERYIEAKKQFDEMNAQYHE